MILANTFPSLPVGPQQDAADPFARKIWVPGQEQESVLKMEHDVHQSTGLIIIYLFNNYLKGLY